MSTFMTKLHCFGKGNMVLATYFINLYFHKHSEMIYKQYNHV